MGIVTRLLWCAVLYRIRHGSCTLDRGISPILASAHIVLPLALSSEHVGVREIKKDGSKLMLGPGLGLSLSTDLMGPMPSELSAYTYSINLINASNLWCCFGGLENKTSADTPPRLLGYVRHSN